MAKILIIDDDVVWRGFLLEVLQQRGHEVLWLGQADEGLQILANQKVDLVLADVNLPGMSGIELLRVLRRQGVDRPVILMTAFAPSPVIAEVENLNALVVSKPMGGFSEFWKELEPKLDQALRGGPEAEIRAYLGRAFDAAFVTRKKGVAAYLQGLLGDVLIVWALNQAGGNQKDAEEILGLRLNELFKQKADETPEGRRQKFILDALTLIAVHPEWTVADYANELDCARGTLYNNETINAAIQRR